MKKKKVLKIYIFRHGQTFYNLKHWFTGWKDSKLAPIGIKQARKVARMLKKKKFQVAFQSDLTRSKQTLKEVMRFHPECKVLLEDKRIKERSYGKLQGHPHKWFIQREGTDDYKTLVHWHKIDHLAGDVKNEFIKKMGAAELKLVRRTYKTKPPGGESIQMVEKRVLEFIRDLLKYMKQEKVNVAISAHGNSMRPFRRYFEKASIKEMMSWEFPFDSYFEYSVKV